MRTTVLKILVAVAFMFLYWTGLAGNRLYDRSSADFHRIYAAQREREWAKTQDEIKKTSRTIQIVGAILTGMIVSCLIKHNKKRQQEKKGMEDGKDSAA